MLNTKQSTYGHCMTGTGQWLKCIQGTADSSKQPVSPFGDTLSLVFRNLQAVMSRLFGLAHN